MLDNTGNVPLVSIATVKRARCSASISALSSCNIGSPPVQTTKRRASCGGHSAASIAASASAVLYLPPFSPSSPTKSLSQQRPIAPAPAIRFDALQLKFHLRAYLSKTHRNHLHAVRTPDPRRSQSPTGATLPVRRGNRYASSRGSTQRAQPRPAIPQAARWRLCQATSVASPPRNADPCQDSTPLAAP